MASMRDAMKRLQVIYEECAPEAAEMSAAEKGLDEYTKLKKKVHQEVKTTRAALKEREDMLSRYGTTSETAEAAYRVRVMIRNLKEMVKRMDELVQKQDKKKGSKRLPEEELSTRKETVQLCFQHIDELENMEKRRGMDQNAADRVNLLVGTENGSSKPPGERRPYGAGLSSPKEQNNDRQALFEGAGPGKKAKNNKNAKQEPDLFASALPDIDTDEINQDFSVMNEKNKQIDDEVDQIGAGVKKLKEIALNMNTELEDQNKNLENLDVNIEKALDGLDNVNIKMKQTIEKASLF